YVTGTIMASGLVANAKGMAPGSNVIGYDWNSDETEVIAAASNGMLISNHSYDLRERDVFGNPMLPNYFFGAYITESRTWDEIMFNAPYYLTVVAAGNSGNDNSVNGSPLNGNSSYDKLTGHATSKNNLVVANAQDASVTANGDLISAIINSTSSEGPTDELRIKPDITGNGTVVYSTHVLDDNQYYTQSGTSMASPNITGSLLLLQEHWYNLNSAYMKSATLKGLALHTADDLGSVGPDAIYGWGLMNTKKAAEIITSKGNESRVEELTLISGSTYTIIVNSDGINPLIASISWTDRPGTATTLLNSSTPVLVNDLDIRVSKSSTTFYPYRLQSVTSTGTGDNIVDPFERIDINGASGTYTITISHKGTLTGGSQDFSLIVSGIPSVEIAGSSLVCNSPTQTYLLLNNPSSSVSWQVSSNLQIVSYSNTQVTVQAVSNTSGNGSGFIKAITANTTVQKDVWVGTQIGDQVFFTNGVYEEGYFCSSHYNNVFTIYPNISGANYQYRLLKHPNFNVVYTSTVLTGNSHEVYYTPSPGWYDFEARIINSCGTSDWFGTELEYVDCSDIEGGGGEHRFDVYPNPSSSQINISFKNTSSEITPQNENITQLKLYDFVGNVLIENKSGSLKTLDVTAMKNGMYYLEITANGIKEIHRVIIEK
uniref:S8 family serine peptidase n=1 Tax=Mariniflexile sp. TaxID=1979402 RepID=UPI0040489B13